MAPTIVIAEIGQNHNGNIPFAERLIDMAAMPIVDHYSGESHKGVDAVKFQKRDLTEELTRDAYRTEYNSPHAFGETYGKHRETLELSYEEHRDLGVYAKEKGLQFIETLCSPRCLKLCEMVDIDYLKVASRDLTNVPLLRSLAAMRIPIILSTGMGGNDDLDQALETIVPFHEQITILHCLSEYPAPYARLGLPRIRELADRYPEKIIGYSDHSPGIMAPVAAVCLGAKVIEKHITLSRQLKGSDHAGALEPDGLWRMVRDIRNVEQALNPATAQIREQATLETREKLQRSLSASRDIDKGECLTESDLAMLSPGTGLGWRQRHLVVGKPALQHIPMNSHLSPAQFTESLINEQKRMA